MHKRFVRVALATAIVATLVVAPVTPNANAQSATGATSFSINFPKVIVLHYWSSLTVDLSTNVMTNFLIGQTTGDDDQGTQSGVSITDNGTNFEVDAAITSTIPGDPSSITLHIENAWAVRAVGASGDNVTMSFDSAPTDLSGSSDSIAVSNGRLGDGATLASYGTTDSFTPPGLVSPTTGGVAIDLDLTNATEQDTYTGSWTLKAEIT